MSEITITPKVGSLPRNHRLLLFALFLAIAAGLSFFALRNLGQWLQIEEPLRHSRAIVVFGGGVPFRAMEAASLYKGGWASEVWLTHASSNEADRALETLGIAATREHEYSRLVLEKLGVPSTAIHVIPDGVNNTVAEVRATLRSSRTPDPLILVTSKYHTRRVRVIWNAVAPRSQTAIVRYASLETYDASRWWRTTTDALATFRELFGILNAWARFPIDPREH